MSTPVDPWMEILDPDNKYGWLMQPLVAPLKALAQKEMLEIIKEVCWHQPLTTERLSQAVKDHYKGGE